MSELPGPPPWSAEKLFNSVIAQEERTRILKETLLEIQTPITEIARAVANMNSFVESQYRFRRSVGYMN